MSKLSSNELTKRLLSSPNKTEVWEGLFCDFTDCELDSIVLYIKENIDVLVEFEMITQVKRWGHRGYSLSYDGTLLIFLGFDDEVALEVYNTLVKEFNIPCKIKYNQI